MPPHISVIIPTYNRANFLPMAIQSALDQTVDLEVVVVDDGSTDDTRRVVADFTDDRIVYIYQENQGATAAFNTGIEKSSGEYISILGSDDWYLPDGMKPLLAELEKNPGIGVVGGGYILVDETGNPIEEVQPWVQHSSLDVNTWLFACPVLLPASLIQRAWIDRMGGFDTAIRVTQDWDFGLRLAYAGCPMIWVPTNVFCYRLHRTNSVKNIAATRQDSMAILDKFFAHPDLPPGVRAIESSAYSRAYLIAAGREYASKQFEQARQDLAQGIQLDPGLLHGDSRRLFHTFATWARSPMLATNPASYLRDVAENLPEPALEVDSAPGRTLKRSLAELAAVHFFEAYRSQDRRAMWRFALDMARSWLPRALDRGVIAILLESILGPKATRWMRRCFGWLNKARHGPGYPNAHG